MFGIKYFQSLWSMPHYSADTEYKAIQKRGHNLAFSPFPHTETRALFLDYAYRAYQEQRELFFKLETKRDEFLKFNLGLIVVMIAGVTSGKITANFWFLFAVTFLAVSVVVLVLSRLATTIPNMPEINVIRACFKDYSAYSEKSNLTPENHICGSLANVTAAIDFICVHRAAHLNIALTFLIGSLLSIITWFWVSFP